MTASNAGGAWDEVRRLTEALRTARLEPMPLDQLDRLMDAPAVDRDRGMDLARLRYMVEMRRNYAQPSQDALGAAISAE